MKFPINQLLQKFLKQLQKACYGSDIAVSGQESMSFWGSNSLKPDVVLRKGTQTFIIDTKWKRPNRSSASVNDLRQMYAYCRFWDAEKALLLYPGDQSENKFKSYETDDYTKDDDSNHTKIDHQCKMGFVSVLDENEQLDKFIGKKVLELIGLSNN